MLRDDFDPAKTVVLEQEPAEGPSQATEPSGSDLTGAEIKLYTPHRVEIEANLDADGFLLLSDTFYPGWRAYVDGQEVQVYRADYLFRAVPAPAGRSEIVLVYRPLSVSLGVVISAASLLATTVLLLQSRRSRHD